MEKHKIILAAFYIVFGAFGLVAAVFIFGTIFIVGIFTAADGTLEVTGLLLATLAVLLFSIAIPGIVGGAGLLLQKPWAKNLLLLVGILYLIFLPLGTVLGIYTFLVLLRDELSLLFISPGTYTMHKLANN